jgi:hypothetical protein
MSQPLKIIQKPWSFREDNLVAKSTAKENHPTRCASHIDRNIFPAKQPLLSRVPVDRNAHPIGPQIEPRRRSASGQISRKDPTLISTTEWQQLHATVLLWIACNLSKLPEPSPVE